MTPSGAALPGVEAPAGRADHAACDDAVQSLARRAGELMAERDRARATAVHLEQRLAAVAALLPAWNAAVGRLSREPNSMSAVAAGAAIIGATSCMADLERVLGVES